MLQMALLFLLYSLPLLSSLTGASQESVENLALHEASPASLRGLALTGVPVGVSMGSEHLIEVSNSLIVAEKWVRTHVLAHYPATRISTIVLGYTVLCDRNEDHHQMGLVLPAAKNIYHSLTRWGLETEIGVSASFSSNCLNLSSASYRDDLADKYIKPLLHFLQAIKSTYSVNPPTHFPSSPEDTLSLVSSHAESMKNIGVFNLNKINFLIAGQKETKKPMNRKLSFMDPSVVEPYPARPTPLPLAPTNSPVGYSAPAFPATSPLPPLIGTSSPPPAPFLLPHTPKLPPVVCPASPPPLYCPPCNTGGAGAAPPPVFAAKNELWCVAKPSVPAVTLQVAMDYACGEGGADCEAIKPYGNCYNPDTVVAHASYAFNSYWQKNKRNGGTCSFGGTAILINADPSFQYCQFILS